MLEMRTETEYFLFKTHRERYNLDRVRNQFALLADMERKRTEMNRIISELSE